MQEMKGFEGAYNPKITEEKIYKLWEESGFFAPEAREPRADNLNSEKTFTIVLPPPNITGSLHMGHALNATVQDILIRKKRMEGYRTLWLPGTDHAGIATQNVVEKELKKEGLTRHDLGREQFIKKVWEWKEKYGDIILDQLKKLGASCDWSRTAFTMDENYKKAVETAFLHYHKKGLIYQGERVINWCPRCATSLSDLEIEYKEEKGKLYFIKYPLVHPPSGGPKYIIVATTRPETMLGDTAVAVHPGDARYKNLAGKAVLLPIQNKEIPVIADEAIDMKFGTGAVKVTPAHSMIDAEIGERHKLPAIKIINEKGKMTSGATFCAGMNVEECRKKVVEELEHQNLIEKVEDITHNVSHCYRCDKTIEQLLSRQWFLRMQGLAKIAMDAVKSEAITFYPKNFEKIYLDWLANIRDWCISRQIWWGHRLPVWFHEEKCVPFPGREAEIEKCEEIKVSPAQPACEHCAAKFIQSEDVLDTWFSSALWPLATLGWPQETKDFETFYPTQVLSTARDIINLWVARMIFSGLEFTGKKPFSQVYIHPTILTKDGKRMSKSLGTGVDPLGLIEKYGADATRFGLIWQNMGGQDIHFSEEHCMAGKKFANKLWNIARYIMIRTGNNWEEYIVDPKRPFHIDEISGSFSFGGPTRTSFEKVEKMIENYAFGEALHHIYDNLWHDVADKYLEKSKDIKNNPELEREIKINLTHFLVNILKLLHPFMPFITEEIWSKLPVSSSTGGKKLLMIENWPVGADSK